MALSQVSICVTEMKVDQTFAMPFELEQPKKSGRNVVKLGLILFCLSSCLAVNAVTIGIITAQWQSSGITFTCSLLYILLSLLAMYGEGGDNKYEKQILIGCIGLTVVGIGAIIIGINFNVESWQDLKQFYNTKCYLCESIHNTSLAMMNDNATTSVDDFHMTYAPDYVNSTESFVNITTYYDDNDISVTSSFEMNTTTYFNYNSTSSKHVEDAVCAKFCSQGRTNLFFILIGLMLCNCIMSIGLSYIIFITRFRNSDYVPAVAL